MITSRSNERVKRYRNLLSKPEEGFVALEGPRLIEDSAAAGAKIVELFYTTRSTRWQGYHRIRASASSSGALLTEVSEDILSYMSDVEHPQGMAAISEWKPADEIDPGRMVIALDSVQDPGNVGTIIRTAAALGFGSVILGGDTAKANTPKVARASMGSIFRVAVLQIRNLAGALEGMKECGYSIVALDIEGEPLSGFSCAPQTCLIVGAEVAGISELVKKSSDSVVSIPMHAGVESLNASIAASLAMWELTRKA